MVLALVSQKMESYYRYIACILLMIFSTIYSAGADICQVADEQDLAEHLHRSAGPRAGPRAGVFTHGLVEGRNATTVAECLLSCCTRPRCNSVFYHQGHCYLITCNRSIPDGCDPVKHNEKKFANTYYITVRTIEETSGLVGVPLGVDKVLSDDTTTADLHNADSAVMTQCIMDTNEGCDVNEKCSMYMNDSGLHYVCECVAGYQRDSQNKCTVRSSDRSCELKVLDDCLPHEQCLANDTKSRTGICQCVSGYVEDPDTGLCVLDPGGPSDVIQGEEDGHGSLQDVHAPSPQTTPASNVGLTSSTKPSVTWLVVSAGENQEITLPKDDITLHAFVIPTEDKDTYQYQWSLVSEVGGEDIGEMVGINTDSLQLSHLVAGLYTFKVVVTAEGKYGEAFVNVTVNPPARVNVAPTAVIKPPNQSVTQPNDVILDGSESSDDDKIVQYHWEQVSKPVEAPAVPDQDMNKSILVLKGLVPGNYKFKLTVTDSDGAQNSTFANVTVIKETDYPPRANAGSNVIINLPQNSVTLYGNGSTDDKGIASYEWIKNSDDKLTADMKGVRTPILHLENLEEGDYKFTLKVTDTAGQVDTADVHVFVKPEHNKPPLADAGHNKTIWLPIDTVTLSAVNSTDDQHIDSYQWTQISGPSSVVIQNADRPVATVSGLVPGVYKFKVTVSDNEGLQASNTVYITVKEDENKPPVANAGGNKVITLPEPLVILDGSKSTDDRGIVSWQWTRDENSLAAGVVINGSDHKPLLELVNLVSGQYVFTLKVTDAEGYSASDTVTLTVNPVKNKDDLVELKLDANIHEFTESNKRNLESQLALLLHRHLPNIEVHIDSLTEDPYSGNLLVIFYVYRELTGTPPEMISGLVVASTLRNRLWSDTNLLDYSVLSIDTLICQNNCTGHGYCEQSTKKCQCEAFWMENPFKAYIEGENNCEWSVLYVIIVAFVSIVLFIGVVWGIVFMCKRWYWTRPKKRHRYSLLDNADDADDGIQLIKRGNIKQGKHSKTQTSSVMISESDFTSEDETLFVKNGHAVRVGLTDVNT